MAKITKQQLLDAAEQVVFTKGASKLTLNAVAKEAGVSKGGLLYHFPSKDELIQAMIQQLIENFENARSQQADHIDGSPDWLQAYINTTFDPELSQVHASAGILAAIANNLNLLEPLRQQYQVWQQHIETSGIDPTRALLLQLAADGLWFAELLQLISFSPEQRQKLLAEMTRLIHHD